MLRPKIKHKVKEFEEIQQEKTNRTKRTIGFLLLFLVIVFLGGSFLNNYISTRITFKTQSSVEYKGLTFKLDTNKTYYSPGEKIIIYFYIINNTNKKVRLDFLNSNLVYFTVYSYIDLKLTKIYYKVWTNKTNVEGSKYSLTLKPNEKLVISEVWDQVDMNGNPVKTGVYKFVAELNISDRVVLRK
jgi:hypothetical protein